MTSAAAVAESESTATGGSIAPANLDRNASADTSGRLQQEPIVSSCLPRRASTDSLFFRFHGKNKNGSSKLHEESVSVNNANGKNWGRKKVSNSTDPLNVSLPNHSSDTIKEEIHSGNGNLPMALTETFIPIKSCLSSKNLLGDEATLSQPSQPHSSKIKKNVSFHTIEIREHERALSDNPGVSSGPALGIGWNSIDSLQCTVAEWEEHRPPRRSKSNLVIPAYLREQILRDECNITNDEINQSLRQTTRIKVSRIHASKETVPTATKDHETRPRLYLKGWSKFLKPSESNAIDKQVELLLEQSIQAERKRLELRQAYLAARQESQPPDDDGPTDELNSGAIISEETTSIGTTTITEGVTIDNSDVHVEHDPPEPSRYTNPPPSSPSRVSTRSPFQRHTDGSSDDDGSPTEERDELWEF
jgi:hypothetical protein